MSDGEALYLALVIATGITFAVILAWGSYRTGQN